MDYYTDRSSDNEDSTEDDDVFEHEVPCRTLEMPITTYSSPTTPPSSITTIWQITPPRNLFRPPTRPLDIVAPSSGIDAANEIMLRHAAGSPNVFVSASAPTLPRHCVVFTFNRAAKEKTFKEFFEWLEDGRAQDAAYEFSVSFIDEEVYGDGMMREFFRIVWDDHVVPNFFSDNDVSGLPLPSTRVNKLAMMTALGKFIALSLYHDYLPLHIHPLTYLRGYGPCRWTFRPLWRDLALLYDPLQVNMLPVDYCAFEQLDEKRMEELEAKYNFSTDICDVTEITASNYGWVLQEMCRRIVCPFATQRSLARVYEGIFLVKMYIIHPRMSSTMLRYEDKGLFETFMKANAMTADDFIQSTTFAESDDPAVQLTYRIYEQTLRSMDSDDLKKWCLFVNNTTVLRPMRVSISTTGVVCTRTCFSTFEFGRCYDDKDCMREDMSLMMSFGFGQMTERFEQRRQQ